MTFLVLAACQEEERPASSVDPTNFENAKAACDRDGGNWIARGTSGVMTCQRTTKDAGQRCTSSRDCEGLCLARSGTCAPAVPLFGCNDVLGSNGQQSTLCLE